MTRYRLIQGNCIDVMQAAKPMSVHAVVCDPPYGIEFAGNTWDSPGRMIGTADGAQGGFHNIPAGEPRPDMDRCDPQLFQRWCQAWGEAALRVLKPGGHVFAFGSPRMYHRLASGLEDAGLQIRDMVGWIHGEGFAKAKQIAGHEGWKTPCLSPAIEPIVVARRPLAIPGKRAGTWKKATTRQNMDVHGVGAFNIDAARVGDELIQQSDGINGWNDYRHGEGKYTSGAVFEPGTNVGRFPKNVMIDEEVAAELGDYARYFYVAKVKGDDRPDHPTVKPVQLMQRLICHELIVLSTPPGGQVLDPFMGSGTTGVAALQAGMRFIGIEMEPKYVDLARERLEMALQPGVSCPITMRASVDCATPANPCWTDPSSACHQPLEVSA